MVKDPILLSQLTDYFKNVDGAEIQVVFEDQEWDDYDQVSINSRLLKPYLDCKIKNMGVERCGILRVSLEEQKDETE